MASEKEKSSWIGQREIGAAGVLIGAWIHSLPIMVVGGVLLASS